MAPAQIARLGQHRGECELRTLCVPAGVSMPVVVDQEVQAALVVGVRMPLLVYTGSARGAWAFTVS